MSKKPETYNVKMRESIRYKGKYVGVGEILKDIPARDAGEFVGSGRATFDLNAMVEAAPAQTAGTPKKDADFKKYEANLAAREKGLSVKEADLAEREKDLSAKEADLAEREKDLSAKEADLAEREKDLSAKEADLAEREKALAELENQDSKN